MKPGACKLIVNLGLSHEQQGPKYLSRHLLLLKVHISTKLDQEVEDSVLVLGTSIQEAGIPTWDFTMCQMYSLILLLLF